MNDGLREFLAMLAPYKGRILGVIFGAFVALMTAIFGFWAGVFTVFCLILGYFIGKYFDNKESLHGILARFLPPGND